MKWLWDFVLNFFVYMCYIYIYIFFFEYMWKTGQNGQPPSQQAVATLPPLPTSAEVTDVFGCIQLLTWAWRTWHRSSCLYSNYSYDKLSPQSQDCLSLLKNLCLPVCGTCLYSIGGAWGKRMVDSRLAWATWDAISKEKLRVFKNEKWFSCVCTVCFIETIIF